MAGQPWRLGCWLRARYAADPSSDGKSGAQGHGPCAMSTWQSKRVSLKTKQKQTVPQGIQESNLTTAELQGLYMSQVRYLE